MWATDKFRIFRIFVIDVQINCEDVTLMSNSIEEKEVCFDVAKTDHSYFGLYNMVKHTLIYFPSSILIYFCSWTVIYFWLYSDIQGGQMLDFDILPGNQVAL